jgi:pyruvate/2-oxoglutarate dehydrogenase complex dihydrolipoamide dehydrogenase (E3) component
LFGGVRTGVGLGCVVKPTLTNPKNFETPLPTQTNSVVGVGHPGMQAALTLKKRGHEITLFEKKKLGGQYNLASLPPKKESLNNIISYYDKALKHFGVNIKMQEVTPELINSLNPDMVIMATGSIPIIPPIKNIVITNGRNTGKPPSGKKAVIIGES